MRIPIAISVSVLVGAAPLAPPDPEHPPAPLTLTAAPGADPVTADSTVSAAGPISAAGSVSAGGPFVAAGAVAAAGPVSAGGPVAAAGPVAADAELIGAVADRVEAVAGPTPASPAGRSAPGADTAPSPAGASPAGPSPAGASPAGAASVGPGVLPGPPQVSVQPRSTSRWSFGTAVRPAPARDGAYPEGWLYVAQRQGGRWRVALQGEPSFARLSARARILTAAERRVLAAQRPPAVGRRVQPPSDRRTGMRLPFGVGQRWRYTSGPHPMSGSERSSIDLAGGDGRVLAARGGLAYTMCRNGKGWIRVVHDRGFATDYYHLAGNIRASGRPVAEGAFLGMIGNDVSCGGASTGKHVHFSLLRGGRYVSIDRYSFGKWIIRASRGSYDGTAWHGSAGVRAGAGIVYNYGKLGLNQGVVDTDGGRVLNRRAGPGAGYRVVGTVSDGATVTVACSRRGTAHTGRNAYTSDLWNRLADGSWVSDVFLSTGTADPVAGLCR